MPAATCWWAEAATTSSASPRRWRLDNVDTVADFSAGNSIELDHTVFAGLALGQLSASSFAYDAATGAGPQVVYDHSTGALFFDSNGAAAGGATQFASLTGAPGLDASDFKVI